MVKLKLRKRLIIVDIQITGRKNNILQKKTQNKNIDKSSYSQIYIQLHISISNQSISKHKLAKNKK